MKKVLSIIMIMVLMISGLFVLTGCENGNDNGGNGGNGGTPAANEPKKDLAEISYTLGKGTITLGVPKKEDGTPKYEFTTEKPEGMTKSGSVYLVTDTINIAIATSGMSYNTAQNYKAKYGETVASFDGYLEFIDDTELFNKSYLPGLEQFEINGRKALRYYNRVGGSGDYKYYGFFYKVGADDVYPKSFFEMTVNYKEEEKPTESKELDQEAKDIIDSLKISANQ